MTKGNDEMSLKEKYKEQLSEALEDLKTPGKRKKQIPNILTASRLFSPLLIIPAALTGNTIFAAWAAAGFGLTDLLDGALARKWDAKSDLGADLDAFTDKIFAGTLLIGGAIFNPVLLANIALELVIAGINVKQKLDGKEPKSTQVGRVKTWLLFTLGGLGIVAPALNLASTLVPGLALGTALMQGATIASYIKKYNNPTTKEENTTQVIEDNQPMSYEEPKLDVAEKELAKTYDVSSTPTTDITYTPEQEALAEAIIQHQEQATPEQVQTTETGKVYTKNNK